MHAFRNYIFAKALKPWGAVSLR